MDKRKLNYRCSGRLSDAECYLLVTRAPYRELHWQVPPAEWSWVESLLNETNWDDADAFEKLVERLRKFQLS